MADEIEARENQIGTIEHTRKMLGFLKTIKLPSPTVLEMIRRYEAEVSSYEYQGRLEDQQRVAGS